MAFQPVLHSPRLKIPLFSRWEHPMSTAKAAWNTDQVVDVLQGVPLFQGLPRADLERIARLVRGRKVEAAELVFREGDPGDKFYIVFSGSVEIIKERPRGDNERLAVKRAGEAFGEMSLLSDAPRSASVRATEQTQLLAVSRDQFDELLGGESLAVRLLQGLARALRALDVRFAARESSVPGSSDVLRDFSRLVQRGLLPRQLPDAEGFELAAAIAQPETASGEALWDAFRAEGTAMLSVMDVKGTGLPSAYLLGITRGVMREVTHSGAAPDRLLARVNEAVSQSVFEGLDECVQAAALTFSGGVAHCAIAGEQPGLLVRSHGTVDELPPHGPPLGILPGFDFGASQLAMAAGDTVVLFSEAERGLLRGAGVLLSTRRQESLHALADQLHTALLRAHGTQDVAFVMARKL
jgi:CRP-like cAMP-binding protein